MDFFLNSNKATTKFDYFTLVNSMISDSPIKPNGSVIDFDIQTKGFVNDGNDSWAVLYMGLDTWEIKINALAVSEGRCLLSSIEKGFQKKSGSGFVSEYKYLTGVTREIVEFNTKGITVGLNKSSKRGYWISQVNGNFEHVYNTDTISLITGGWLMMLIMHQQVQLNFMDI